MDIKNIVIQGEKRYGLIIDLGNGEELFTKMEGLHVEMILDGIAESGWRLCGLPYDLRNDDGRRLEDIQTIDKAAANITEDDEERAYDLASDQLLREDLEKKLFVPEKEKLVFLESNNAIDTREGLIAFLDLLENSDIKQQGTTINYMPLNSFVSKEALFTVEEYFSPQYSKYKRLIEERRILIYSNYLKLSKDLQEIAGLPKDFTNKDLADAYFRWGICGINTEFYSISTVESNVAIDGYDFRGLEKDRPRVTLKIPTYLTSQGDIIRSKNTVSSDWKVVEDATVVKMKRMKLEELGDEYIDIVNLNTVVNEERTILDGDINVEYNAYRLLLRRGPLCTALPSIQVREPGNARVVMSPSFVGTRSVAGMSLGEYMQCKAIGLGMIARKTINTSGSTYKALTLVGCTPLSMIKLLMNNKENLEDFSNSLKELSLITEDEGKNKTADEEVTSISVIESIEDYLAGEMNETDPKYNTIKYLIGDLIEGNLNYDMILSGENADASESVLDSYINYVYAAHKFLEMSYTDIIKELDKLTVDNDDDLVLIGNNGLKMVVPVQNFNNKKEAYVAQVNNYTWKQASPFSDISDIDDKFAKKILKLYSYVEAVYLELAGKKSAKYHVAAELYMVDLTERGASTKTANLVEYINSIMIPSIKEHTYDTRSGRQQAVQTYSILYANAIMSIARNGCYLMPEEWGGENITPSATDVEILRTYVKRRVDSLALICEKMCAYNGNMMHYVVNATVTPRIVIPRKGWPAIPLRPFVPNWINTDLKGLDVQRNNWYSKGFFGDGLVSIENSSPEMLEKHGGNPNHKGLEPMYDNVRFRDCKGNPAGLDEYYDKAVQIKDTLDLNKALVNIPTPIEIIYPDIYEARPLERNREENEMTGKPLQFAIQKTRQITHKSIVEEFDEIRELLEPDVIQLKNNTGCFLFKDLEVEDYYMNPNVTIEDVYAEIPGVPVTGMPSRHKIIFGKDTIDYLDIESACESGKYQIKRITGRKYICHAKNGKVIEVRL